MLLVERQEGIQTVKVLPHPKGFLLGPVIARFPPFRCRSSVAVSPFLLLAVAVVVGSSASMIGWPTTERNNGKIELDPISTERTVTAAFSPNMAVTERNFLT